LAHISSGDFPRPAAILFTDRLDRFSLFHLCLIPLGRIPQNIFADPPDISAPQFTSMHFVRDILFVFG
jgi:hypothetical protein